MTAPDDGEWIARGRAHQRAGRAVDALLCYRAALRTNRYAIRAHFHAGEALEQLGRDSEAFDAWRAVLILQPRHLSSLLAFGGLARRVGELGESAEAYHRALTVDPQDARARHGLALTRLAAGDAAAGGEIAPLLSGDATTEELAELGRLLPALPASPTKQALLAAIDRRGAADAPPVLAAMLADAAAARGEDAAVRRLIDAAEAGAARIASLDALRLFALAAARAAPAAVWPARYAARCVALHAPEAPLPWPRRTAGAALRVAYLVALGRPLRVGAQDLDPDAYLREVVAAHPRERVAPAVYVVDAGKPSPATLAALDGVPVTALGPAPDRSIAQTLAQADLDAIIDLAGMTAATGPLLAQRPARGIWTTDALFAAHAVPLITQSLPAPRSAAGEHLRAHRMDVEAVLGAALAPWLSPAVCCPLPARAMAELWRDAVRAHQAQDGEAAIAAYRAVIALQPDFSRAHYLLGVLLRDQDRPADALRHLSAALRAAPAFVDARAALANLLREDQRADAAAALCREGLAAQPHAAALWRALGLTELGRRRGAAARAAFDRALAAEPGDAETHYNRGVALQVGRKRRAALVAYGRALALAPDLTAACYNSGVVLREQARADAALAAFERVIAQEPAHVAAHNALCETLREADRIDGWLSAFRRFESHCPDALPMAAQALEACQYQADFAGLERHLERLFRNAYTPGGEIERADCLETLLFLILYFDVEADDVLALYRAYAAVAPRVYGAPVALANPRRPGRIRIGYLSGDLRHHVMGKMMWEAVRRHDRRRFEVFFYSLSAVDDAWTARYRELGDRFVAIAGATEREAAERIAEDDLDLLVDLATNTRGAKPGILACKPARVQITHVASAGVVGLRTIDFKLTDAYADLPGNQAGQLETLLPMGGCVYPYRHIAPAPVHPYHRDRLGIAADAFVIAAFVNPLKLSRRCLALWREVLERVPRALLAISPLSSGAGEAQLKLFGAAGIARERSIVLPAGRDEAENQARYRLVDMVLDPLPYGGVNGTLEALDMGVPVVTLRGRRHGERSSYSILANLGVPHTVADDAVEYVAIAARLAGDREFLAEVKAAIRRGLAGSPLTDMDAHTRHLERAYVAALERGYPASLAESRDG